MVVAVVTMVAVVTEGETAAVIGDETATMIAGKTTHSACLLMQKRQGASCSARCPLPLLHEETCRGASAIWYTNGKSVDVPSWRFFSYDTYPRRSVASLYLYCAG